MWIRLFAYDYPQDVRALLYDELTGREVAEVFANLYGERSIAKYCGIGLSVFFSPDKGGTEGYRAPEVVMGAAPSVRSDAYSFAATFYHLVTGHAPVDGQNLDPAACGFSCPEWLRQLIILCSQPDPDETVVGPNVRPADDTSTGCASLGSHLAVTLLSTDPN